jgi:hypothetical protein
VSVPQVLAQANNPNLSPTQPSTLAPPPTPAPPAAPTSTPTLAQPPKPAPPAPPAPGVTAPTSQQPTPTSVDDKESVKEKAAKRAALLAKLRHIVQFYGGVRGTIRFQSGRPGSASDPPGSLQRVAAPSAVATACSGLRDVPSGSPELKFS